MLGPGHVLHLRTALRISSTVVDSVPCFMFIKKATGDTAFPGSLTTGDRLVSTSPLLSEVTVRGCVTSKERPSDLVK